MRLDKTINEASKGDHCHVDGIERPYEFVSLDKLIENFIVDVERSRHDHIGDPTLADACWID